MDKNKGKIYVVATPIGNLGDITMRAISILSNADLIACEDTRVTQKLMQYYDINSQLITYHQHTKEHRAQEIIDEVLNGKIVAIVTDAGTPGISDPGNKLVSLAIKNNVNVEPVPGATAIGAISSVAGIDIQKFTFLAYPPHKKGRQTFFTKVAESDIPVIYYESVHRVIKNLMLLQEFAPKIKIILGRELTKIHEEIVRGDIDEVLDYFENNPDKIKGEFVIIAYK